MKKVVLVIIGVCVLVGLAYAAFELSSKDKHYSWRYKMTVEVETPEGIKSGNAVRQVNVDWKAIGWDQINNQPHYSTKRNVSGEAVVVDLGDRGTLFALIDSRAYYAAPRAFGIFKFEDVQALPIGSTAELECDGNFECPKMVMFKDINDPKSVELVYVNRRYAGNNGQDVEHENRFEELFGQGVKLKKINVEITDERVTRDIVDKYLPQSFWDQFNLWWEQLDVRTKSKKANLFYFKHGAEK